MEEARGKLQDGSIMLEVAGCRRGWMEDAGGMRKNTGCRREKKG